VLQSLQTRLDDLLYSHELLPQMIAPHGCYGVRLTPVIARQCSNPTLRFEPGNGAIQRAGSKADIREALHVLHDGVTVFVAFGEAGEDEQRRIRHG
jgi:hypothetical protein